MKKVKKKKVVNEYALPTEPTEPCISMLDYSWLIYGAKGIGKTTLAARFPKALHFMFEPGSLALRIFKVPVDGNCFTDWRDVLGYLRSLKKKKSQYRTAVWDTGNKAYDLHMAYAQSVLLDGKHPGELKDYGASWRKVADSFEDAHLKIAALGMGFVCIAHEKYKDFEDIDGKEYVRAQPRFSSGSSEFYEGIIDVIAHYHYEGRQRFLQIRGDEYTVAKCRIEGHFLTPRGAEIWEELTELSNSFGKAYDPENDEQVMELSDELEKHYIYKIPMGNSAMQGYQNVVRAFNNQQTETFKERKEKKAESKPEKKKKKKKKYVVKKKS